MTHNNKGFVLLNPVEKSNAKGGTTTQKGRKELDCYLGNKIYLCLSVEYNCPNEFSTGSCGALNISCSANFTSNEI